MKLRSFISVLIFLTIGCSAQEESLGPNNATSSSDLLPEEKLALVDGKKEPGASRPYAELLDKLQTKCHEERKLIAGMVFGIVKKDLEAGMKADNLDMLQSFLHDADSMFEGKQGSCLDVFSYYRNSQDELSNQ